jgi:AraC family transcriptional regulator of adaptative response/methylated-DNA-[protein]-cysteine methyltransferase
MHCVTIVVVGAEYVILNDCPVKLIYQSPDRRYSESFTYAFVASPCPEYSCCIVWGDEGLYGVSFAPQNTSGSSTLPFIQQRWPQVCPAAVLNQVCNSVPVNVELPAQARGTLVLSGTAFQLQVWRALMEIPAGETRTYSYIARVIGRPRAWRAVANAVAANPLLCLVPCHRVVPRQGGIGNYRCGAELKRHLLAQEGYISLE